MILDMNKFNLFLCIRKKNGIGKKLYSLPIFYRKKIRIIINLKKD